MKWKHWGPDINQSEVNSVDSGVNSDLETLKNWLTDAWETTQDVSQLDVGETTSWWNDPRVWLRCSMRGNYEYMWRFHWKKPLEDVFGGILLRERATNLSFLSTKPWKKPGEALTLPPSAILFRLARVAQKARSLRSWVPTPPADVTPRPSCTWSDEDGG